MWHAYAVMVAIVLRGIPGQTLDGTKQYSATTGQEAIAAMVLNALLLMARGNCEGLQLCIMHAMPAQSNSV